MLRSNSLSISARITCVSSSDNSRFQFGNRGVGVVNQRKRQLSGQSGGYAFRVGKQRIFDDGVVEEGR